MTNTVTVRVGGKYATRAQYTNVEYTIEASQDLTKKNPTPEDFAEAGEALTMALRATVGAMTPMLIEDAEEMVGTPAAADVSEYEYDQSPPPEWDEAEATQGATPPEQPTGDIVGIPVQWPQKAKDRKVGQYWTEELVEYKHIAGDDENSPGWFILKGDDGGPRREMAIRDYYLFSNHPGWPGPVNYAKMARAADFCKPHGKLYIQLAYAGDVYPPESRGAGNLRPVVMRITPLEDAGDPFPA